MLGFNGKIVVITGGSNGIGAATVRRFIIEGASVVIWDITSPDMELYPDHHKLQFISVDVTDPDAVKAAVGRTITENGRIDVLINNAGITSDSQLVKWKDGQIINQMSVDAFDKVIKVNLNGVFNCTQAVVPSMIAHGGGVILNAASVVGLYGNFGQTNYVATKAGVVGMTKTWARELGRYKIRVNAVAPGFIVTDLLKKMPPEVLGEMEKHTPLGRLGTADDVAGVYAFLASEDAAYIHGAVISVDGGLVVGT